MKCFRLVLLLVLLVQSLYVFAHPIENYPLSCSLPAPSTISATDITTSKIQLTWAAVNGANGYKISRFDVTHGVALPDANVAEPGYLSEPHDPGTTIAFEVRAKCQSGESGEAITAEYTTTIIIVDDIVLFSVPTYPTGNIPIYPAGTSSDLTVGMKDAANQTSDVEVIRAKVRYTDTHNNLHFAEFLLWSHCSVAGNNAVRVQYRNPENWPGNVTYVENHINGNLQLPIYSINFKMDGMPFFTLHLPVFYQGGVGLPNSLRIRIRNDFDAVIYYDRSFNVEENPCYGNGGGTISKNVAGGSFDDIRGGTDTESSNDSPSLNESFATTAANTLHVSPNPFNEYFQVEYSLQAESPVLFTLYDLTGRAIKTIQLPTQAAGQYSTSIHENNLPAGIYLLSFQTKQGRTTTTLVKHP